MTDTPRPTPNDNLPLADALARWCDDGGHLPRPQRDDARPSSGDPDEETAQPRGDSPRGDDAEADKPPRKA